MSLLSGVSWDPLPRPSNQDSPPRLSHAKQTQGRGLEFRSSSDGSEDPRGDKRGGGNPGKAPQLRGCDQVGTGCMGGADLCNPSNIRGSGSNGNFKDCGVSLLFSFNDRKMRKEEYVENTKEMGKYIS